MTPCHLKCFSPPKEVSEKSLRLRSALTGTQELTMKRLSAPKYKGPQILEQEHSFAKMLTQWTVETEEGVCGNDESFLVTRPRSQLPWNL